MGHVARMILKMKNTYEILVVKRQRMMQHVRVRRR